MNALGPRLRPFTTLYIGNSPVDKIEKKFQYGSVPYQITLNRTSLVQQVPKSESYELSECLEITPFWEIDSCPEKDGDLLSKKLLNIVLFYLLTVSIYYSLTFISNTRYVMCCHPYAAFKICIWLNDSGIRCG